MSQVSYTAHQSEIVLYTAVQPWHICTVLSIPFCSHTVVVGGRPQLPLVATVRVNPPLVTGRWELWCGHHLAPAVAGLVGSSLDVLLQGFSSWKESIYWPASLVEQMLATFIDMFQATGAIIEHNKTLQCIPEVIYIWKSWRGSQVAECCSDITDLTTGFSGFPCCFLSLASKAWNSSHPLRAWKNGNPRRLLSPNATAMSWAAKNWKFFPIPNATQSSSMSRRTAAATAKTRASVSSVRIDTLLYPCLTASSTWSKILVSASLWLQGSRPATSWAWIQTTSLWCVLMTCLSVSVVASLVARKANSYILFSSVQRKPCQFPGMELDGSTRWLMHLPRFCLVSAFKMSVRYSSQTTSILLVCFSWDVMFGKTTCDAYSSKVFALPGRSILMIAAPSRIMTLTSGLAAAAATFTCGGTRSSKQPIRSDFVPSLILPRCDSAGGHAWFSCAKNSSRSPSRIWMQWTTWRTGSSHSWHLSDWRLGEEREVVPLNWVGDGLCLVDKSLFDLGVLLFFSQLMDLATVFIKAGSARSAVQHH